MSAQSKSLPNDPVQALIVVDMQSAFVSGDDAIPHAERVLQRTEQLLAKARAEDAVVIQLQNDGPEGATDEPGTPGWRLHLPVDRDRGEVVIRKAFDDGFEETELEDLLREEGITSIALCGVMSEMCVSATARTALDLEFRVVLPHDAHGTYDIPAAEGISDAVPAATVSRVAEWALGDEVEVVPSADDVSFTGA
ncbi:cysteine hydrolase family protein [Streptomyces sp. PmtG]